MLPAVERETGAPLAAESIEAMDLDPKRPSVKAICPFCGGEYAAGYSAKDPTAASFYHSIPRCEQALTLHPVEFLRRARLAGARRTRVHEG